LDGDGIGFSFGLNFFLLLLLFNPMVLASLVGGLVSFPVPAAASLSVITSPGLVDDGNIVDKEGSRGVPM
jgi:hypothetical protein